MWLFSLERVKPCKLTRVITPPSNREAWPMFDRIERNASRRAKLCSCQCTNFCRSFEYRATTPWSSPLHSPPSQVSRRAGQHTINLLSTNLKSLLLPTLCWTIPQLLHPRLGESLSLFSFGAYNHEPRRPPRPQVHRRAQMLSKLSGPRCSYGKGVADVHFDELDGGWIGLKAFLQAAKTGGTFGP